ncbi:MAG: 1-(5-phosphoribosyl)-5-[(5-phosphoribosylamino)methylideneamino]imidazole-4-carboxamide isomerase [Tepidiformaceae bacterium]
MFDVIPAIDILGGRCVRLFQGDYARETVYSEDPLAMAKHWQSLGAPRLHVVDLDGAKTGRPVNHREIEKICLGVRLPVEVSGGIRDVDAILLAFSRGATQVQLGSVAVQHPEVVREAVRRWGFDIVVSIDARDGEVRTDGWTAGSGVPALQFAREMADAGVSTLMFTDIGRDSTLTEPNFTALEELVRALPGVRIIASGGVAEVAHLVRLGDIGCSGAIVGKALYEGTIELPEALAAVEQFWELEAAEA